MIAISLCKKARATTTALLVIVLSGCATFSEDGGFELVTQETESKLGITPRWSNNEAAQGAVAKEVGARLKETLTADGAMQVALLSNPALQAEYANLGISEADFVQAGRLPNPGFSFGKTSGGGAVEIERGLHFNVLALLTLPIRSGIESRRFEAAKLGAAAATVATALEARSAFFEAVAARQKSAYFREVVESAEASKELMSRMSRVGNASRLDLAQEQLFHAEAVTSLEKALLAESAATEALIRMLGLWGEQTDIKLPERLPDIPRALEDATDIEQRAIAQRFDVRRSRASLDALSSNLGLTEVTGFINVLEAGPAQVRERGEPIRDGYEIALEIPIFDWGGAKVKRAESLYRQGVEQLRAAAIGARSEVRQSYRAYRAAHAIAKHYRDELVPLRKRISDEQLLRYNGMLIGIFELIADARMQVSTVSAYVESLREFWLADTNLKISLLVGSPSAMSTNTAALPAGVRGGGH